MGSLQSIPEGAYVSSVGNAGVPYLDLTYVCNGQADLTSSNTCYVYDPQRTEAPWFNSTSAYPQAYSNSVFQCTITNFLCPIDTPYACGRACFNDQQYTCVVDSEHFFNSYLVLPGTKVSPSAALSPADTTTTTSTAPAATQATVTKSAYITSPTASSTTPSKVISVNVASSSTAATAKQVISTATPLPGATEIPVVAAAAAAAAATTQPPTETATTQPPTETATTQPPTETATSQPPTETATSTPTQLATVESNIATKSYIAAAPIATQSTTTTVAAAAVSTAKTSSGYASNLSLNGGGPFTVKVSSAQTNQFAFFSNTNLFGGVDLGSPTLLFSVPGGSTVTISVPLGWVGRLQKWSGVASDPATWAEFNCVSGPTIFYDVSVIQGYNGPMTISASDAKIAGSAADIISGAPSSIVGTNAVGDPTIFATQPWSQPGTTNQAVVNYLDSAIGVTQAYILPNDNGAMRSTSTSTILVSV